MLALSKKIMNKCNVMLFAAGLGTRLKPATDLHPKPTLPLNQIPLGYYALPYLDHIIPEQFIVNTFHLPSQIHELYQPISKDIKFSDEIATIKGSGGGLKQAEKYFNLNLPILTMNADEVFFTAENNFIQIALKKHIDTNALATLVVTEHPEAGHKFGAIWCNGDQVIHIGKSAPADFPQSQMKPWHFTGVQIISSKILNEIPRDVELNIFYDVIINKLKTETINICPIKCDWYEVGNMNDYKIAKQQINEKLKTDPIYKTHYKDLKKYPLSKLSDLT